MSTETKSTKTPKAKKEPRPKKPARAKIEVTNENLKVVRERAAVVDYSLAAIRQAHKCTWNEAVALRRAALKSDKS